MLGGIVRRQVTLYGLFGLLSLTAVVLAAIRQSERFGEAVLVCLFVIVLLVTPRHLDQVRNIWLRYALCFVLPFAYLISLSLAGLALQALIAAIAK